MFRPGSKSVGVRHRLAVWRHCYAACQRQSLHKKERNSYISNAFATKSVRTKCYRSHLRQNRSYRLDRWCALRGSRRVGRVSAKSLLHNEFLSFPHFKRCAELFAHNAEDDEVH